MRFMLILVIVGCAIGGWWYFSKRNPAAASDGGELVLNPDTPDASGTAASATAGGATGQATGGLPALGASELPSETKRALEQADALWAQAGAEAVTGDQATTLTAMYGRILQSLYNQPGMREHESRLIAERLAPLGTALFFSKSRYPTDATGTFAIHVVAAGENPDAIAKKYGMSRELLNRLRGRGVNDSNLSAGDALKVVKVKEKGFALRVDKGDYVLDCYVAGLFARRYACSIGAKSSPTPIGRARLANRVWHPDWTHPDTKQVLHYGDPGNILGPIWLPLSADDIGQSGIGIHGYTGDDAKSGAMVSHGCVRLKNEEAEELYQTLSHPDRAQTVIEIAE
ncbi:MAG: L,D-transpeptidase family protein [Planctomycetes bacterium]|nr:L,D-transpeptidase family protein [Planctomycetota bacterium]